MNITLAHHWLVDMRGGEKVLEQLCLLFPRAQILTLLASPNNSSDIISRHSIRQTLLGQLPQAHRYYRYCLPLFPLFLLNKKASGDLLISSDASLIKAIGKAPGTQHVCYCHSPPRYLWDLQEEYLKSMSRGLGTILKMCTGYLRAFDRRASRNVDHFIANSSFVVDRIRRCYGRKASVVYPPVDVSGFTPGASPENFYLIVSALEPYKRIDIAVKAFNRLGLRLVIIGEGPERRRLESLATSRITFLGAQPFEILRSHYQRCKAFVFPGIEDFGISPLEAQAAGRPVIALGRGGALETVIDNATGIFFTEQTEDSLIEAVGRMEREAGDFDPRSCRENALRFRPEVFRSQMLATLAAFYPDLFRAG
ncbi:glycosyltransferase [Desulfonatronum parangueonense]